jgi:hypothetical protein
MVMTVGPSPVLVSSKPHSPKVATTAAQAAAEAALINKYVTMAVRYRQTHDPTELKEINKFYNENNIGKIPYVNSAYIQSEVDKLEKSLSSAGLPAASAASAASAGPKEKLLHDLSIIIQKENGKNKDDLQNLYRLFEQDKIDEGVRYFLVNGLWKIDHDIIDILQENPTVLTVIEKLEASPVAASPAAAAAAASSWSSDDGSKRAAKPKIMIKLKSPKSLSATASVPMLAAYSGKQVKRVRRAASASASVVPPKLPAKAGKALDVSKAAAAEADDFLSNLLTGITKKQKREDKIGKRVVKYNRLLHAGKLREAEKYFMEKLEKIPEIREGLKSAAGFMDDLVEYDSHASVTPPADSPVALSPEVLKHAPFSFGQAAAMAEAKGTPRAKGKGAIAGTKLSPVSQLHKELVKRNTSPTFNPDDPKYGDWAG